MQNVWSPAVLAALMPGDQVTLRDIEDGEILPGGDYLVAEVLDGGKSFKVQDHPRVTVFPHRIERLYVNSPRTIRPDARI
ncbi:MAG: hypothetical protein WBL20_16915 [Sphingobium sp.]|uniref:hypothetical protein n=1 Tax=Sphingobium sp. TaxID=1912891 RepID=UPI003BAF1C54